MPAPAVETKALDPRSVKERAKSIFRQTYRYPSIPFRSIGRACFAWALKKAWHELVHGTEAEQREREAQAIADAYGFDVDALMFQCDRRRFGSFTTTLDGFPERLALFERALEIACVRRLARNPQSETVHA